MKLADPRWNEVLADVAHIHGVQPGSARYDTSMTDDDRRAFDNLILVCPNHHRLIDRLQPDDYPADMLRHWKANHEAHCAGTWTDEASLDRYSLMLADALARAPSLGPAGMPRLLIENRDRDTIEVVNVGDADAVEIRIEPVDDKTAEAWVEAGGPPTRLSPGGRWRAGIHAASLGNAGPHVLRLLWKSESGMERSGEFPL